MPVYSFRTMRTIEVIADDEDEADRMVQAELHDGEQVIAPPEVWDEED